MSTNARQENERVKELADTRLKEILAKYADTNKPQRVSFRDLCGQWNWAKRSDKYTHFMHRYPAKLLPYIPIFFLSSGLLRQNDTVLDSFAGSGTVGVESIVHKYSPHNCVMVELNPLARLISSVKVTPIDPIYLKQQVLDFLNYLDVSSSLGRVPLFPNVEFWFRQKAQIDLALIRSAIETFKTTSDVADFLWVTFSSIIRDMSRADPKIAPPVVFSIEGFKGKRKNEMKKYLGKKRRYDAKQLFKNAAIRNIARMAELWDNLNLRDSIVTAKVVGMDARSLAEGNYLRKGKLEITGGKIMEDGSIGFVITSPPYLSAQKYARTTKLELWWLNLISETQTEFNDLAKKMIGTDRISSMEAIESSGNKIADRIIHKLAVGGNQRDAKMIGTYFRDMRLSISEMYRVLRKDGHCVIVVGNNRIRDINIPNHKILNEIAVEIGFTTKAILVDKIKSRGMIMKRHSTGGIIKDEWVLLLQKKQGV